MHSQTISPPTIAKAKIEPKKLLPSRSGTSDDDDCSRGLTGDPTVSISNRSSAFISPRSHCLHRQADGFHLKDWVQRSDRLGSATL